MFKLVDFLPEISTTQETEVQQKRYGWRDMVSLFKEDTCNGTQTCKSRCDETYSETIGCACNNDCYLFGDCCLDYFMYCFENEMNLMGDTENDQVDERRATSATSDNNPLIIINQEGLTRLPVKVQCISV